MKHISGMRFKALLALTLACLLLTAGALAAGGLPESSHPYDNNADESWTYTYPGSAAYLKITFSADSRTETGWDFVYVTDAEGTQQTLSGSLADKAIYVEGNSFTIRLTSDGSVTYYGFAVESVEAVSEEEFSRHALTVQDGAIIGYYGKSEVLEIPSEIDGQEITSIGNYAFQSSSLKQVIFPTTVTSIGSGAFRNCQRLTGVTIPGTVETVGNEAFRGCTALTSVSLKEGIKKIGSYCFAECTALTGIRIPSTVTEVESWTFYNCSALKQVNVTGGVIALANSAFSQCAALENVNASITALGSNAFYGCTSLPGVTLAEGITTVGNGAFHSCSSLKTVRFPASVTSIPYSMFSGCTSLEEVTLDAPATNLGEWVFEECSALERVNGNILSIGDYCFYGCSNLKSLSLDDGMETLNSDAKIPGSAVLTIGQNCKAFSQILNYGYSYIIRETGETNVVNSTATTVNQKVKDVVAAVIRPGMTDYEKALALHNWLMYNANYDYTYTYYSANGVLLYGTGVCQSYALAYQKLLNAVNIPNALEYGDDHVWNMIQLDGEWYHVDVTWDDPGRGGYEYWGFFGVTNYALEGVDSHECYNKPHVATAYKYNFYYRNGMLDSRLTELSETISARLNEGLTEFSFVPETFGYDYPHGIPNRTAILVMRDQGATYDGKPIPVSITLDSGTKTVTVKALRETQADFTLPKGNKVIAEEAYSGIGAAVVVIPGGVTSIGKNAFAHCAALRQITIPASVTFIDETAFDGVTGLRIVGVPGSAAETFARNMGIVFLPLD